MASRGCDANGRRATSGCRTEILRLHRVIEGVGLLEFAQEDELERRRYTENEVLDVMRELAGILKYLHGLSPPVVHRDVKPKNVLRRPDRRLALVDFGSVRAAIEDPVMGGNTIVGTYGYMAPEQFRGDASVQTDLYGLGALAVRLLTREPTDLIDHSGRIAAWRRHANVSACTVTLLDALLELDPDQRPSSANDVIARIDAIRTAPAVETQPPSRARRMPELASFNAVKAELEKESPRRKGERQRIPEANKEDELYVLEKLVALQKQQSMTRRDSRTGHSTGRANVPASPRSDHFDRLALDRLIRLGRREPVDHASMTPAPRYDPFLLFWLGVFCLLLLIFVQCCSH